MNPLQTREGIINLLLQQTDAQSNVIAQQLTKIAELEKTVAQHAAEEKKTAEEKEAKKAAKKDKQTQEQV